MKLLILNIFLFILKNNLLISKKKIFLVILIFKNFVIYFLLFNSIFA